jgi:hypothetical protein
MTITLPSTDMTATSSPPITVRTACRTTTCSATPPPPRLCGEQICTGKMDCVHPGCSNCGQWHSMNPRFPHQTSTCLEGWGANVNQDVLIIFSFMILKIYCIYSGAALIRTLWFPGKSSRWMMSPNNWIKFDRFSSILFPRTIVQKVKHLD